MCLSHAQHARHVTRTSHARTAGAYAAGAFALCTSRSGVCGRSGVRGVPKGVQQASISWSGVFRMRCYIQCAARIPIRLGGAWSRGGKLCAVPMRPACPSRCQAIWASSGCVFYSLGSFPVCLCLFYALKMKGMVWHGKGFWCSG